MMRRGFGTMLLLSALCACASTSPVPYWDDLDWLRSLKVSIGRNESYPSPIVTNALPAGEGTVGFDYQGGKLTNVVLIQSTGSQVLDDAIVKAVRTASPPRAHGEYRDEPHHFQFVLDLSPDIATVRLLIYNRVTDNMRLSKQEFPPQPVMIFVRADYLNGAFVSVDSDQSGGYEDIASKIVAKVRKAPLPDAPVNFRDKHIRVDMQFCLSVEWKPCDYMQESKWADFGGLSYAIPPN